jgi:pyruvate,water dikinase
MINFLGIIIILIVSPLIGAIPVIAWITYAISGKDLAKIGTRNISVAAAFYHGGKLAGNICVVSEAIKGIAVVTIAQLLTFPRNLGNYRFNSFSCW